MVEKLIERKEVGEFYYNSLYQFIGCKRNEYVQIDNSEDIFLIAKVTSSSTGIDKYIILYEILPLCAKKKNFLHKITSITQEEIKELAAQNELYQTLNPNFIETMVSLKRYVVNDIGKKVRLI